MATTPRSEPDRQIDYPTSDGRPMGETEIHINALMNLLQTLRAHFAAEPMVYVGGNMLLFYERGNRRKHISPDVFFVRGVEKRSDTPRDYYLLWDEGKGPDVVIELTSRSTRPRGPEDKEGPLSRRRASRGVFPVRPEGRLPEAADARLPVGGGGVPANRAGRGSIAQCGAGPAPGACRDGAAALRPGDRPPLARHARGAAEAEAERRRADDAERRADAAEAEVERLRREIEAMRRGSSGPS